MLYLLNVLHIIAFISLDNVFLRNRIILYSEVYQQMFPTILLFNVGHVCECDFNFLENAHTNLPPGIRVHPRRPLEWQQRNESTIFQKRTITCLLYLMHLYFICFLFSSLALICSFLGSIRCSIEVRAAIPYVAQYHRDVWKAGYRDNQALNGAAVCAPHGAKKIRRPLSCGEGEARQVICKCPLYGSFRFR